MDSSVDPQAIEVSARRKYTGELGTARCTAQQGGAGFGLETLRPGLYTLELSCAGEELITLPVLAVKAGRTTRPRPIDLRARVHGLTLSLVSPSPGFELTGTLSYAAAGGGSARELDIRSSHVALATTIEHVELRVRVKGCRSEQLLDPGAYTEIFLRPSCLVRLVLPRLLRLPEPPCSLGITLDGADESSLEPRAFDSGHELLFHVADPGTYNVGWFAQGLGGSGGGWLALDVLGQVSASVFDRVGEQRIELPLTSDQLAAALAAR